MPNSDGPFGFNIIGTNQISSDTKPFLFTKITPIDSGDTIQLVQFSANKEYIRYYDIPDSGPTVSNFQVCVPPSIPGYNPNINNMVINNVEIIDGNRGYGYIIDFITDVQNNCQVGGTLRQIDNSVRVKFNIIPIQSSYTFKMTIVGIYAAKEIYDTASTLAQGVYSKSFPLEFDLGDITSIYLEFLVPPTVATPTMISTSYSPAAFFIWNTWNGNSTIFQGYAVKSFITYTWDLVTPITIPTFRGLLRS